MNGNRIGEKILLFIINPFISAISSFLNIRDGASHWFVYAWFIVFGISFCAVNEAADSFRYVQAFNIEHTYSLNEYISEISSYLTFQTNIKDIYTLTVNFIVGRFTDNYHWTFLIYAIVFGYFYIKSLIIYLRQNEVKSNIVFFALLFIFCYSNPIFNINGVRFWTAAWIGVYVALSCFVEKDYKKLPLLLLMPLIHGASIIWILIMLIAMLLFRLPNLAVVLFIVSSFVSAISFLPILDSFSYLLPKFMQNQIVSYTESEWALERMSGHSEYGAAYADFLIALPKYWQLLMIYLLIINRKKIKQNEQSANLLSITLVMSAVANFLSSIPSLGRFQYLVIPFIVILWAKNYHILKKYDKLFLLVPVLYAYSLLYWYRNVSSVTELSLYICPLPITIIKYLII